MATTDSYEGIVVLGMPRSGTTLIRRLLDAHPDIACPPETNLLRGASRMLYEDRSVAGLSVGVLPGLAFSGYSEAEVLRRVREFAFGFFRELAAKGGKKVWAEKTAFDVFYVDEIERLLGDTCRFICVFRHGLDVVCSVKELCDGMDRYLVELHEYVCRHSSPYDAFAHAWVDCNRRLKQFMDDHSNLCVPLRYEELLHDPATQLTRVFDFLNKPTDVDAVIARAFQGAEVGLGDWKTYATSGFDTSSVGRWKNLTEDRVAQLAAIINPTMELIGYEPVVGGRVPSREEAIPHYRASNMVIQMNARRSGRSV